MNRKRRAVMLLLFLLLLHPLGWTMADEGQGDAVAEGLAAEAVAPLEEASESSSVHVNIYAGDTLYKQIQNTYKAARKRSRRRSFKGYCGAYVANQLVVLGINKSYLSANGKNTYDIYRNMDVTTGGYGVTAYSAKKYTLKEALSTITDRNPSARNILVGFQRGTSSSGKKYGHVLFIHGVKNGKIFYSDSCARTIDDVKYKEGEPIVCSMSAFLELYAKYKLDGVVHFEKGESGKKTAETYLSINAETASVSSEKAVAVG